MKLGRLWFAILLAFAAMQAHALLHVDHDLSSGSDSSCLSCKLNTQLGSGATPSAGLSLAPAAAPRFAPTATALQAKRPARIQPPARAPPLSL